MENIVLISPTIENENEANEFVKEFLEDNSHINGSSGLPKYIDNYKSWLEKIQNESNIDENRSDRVPSSTFFAVRRGDNKIIGIVNIRHKLIGELLIKGGHIGYSVRPSERRKGNATEILYLGLLKIREKGIKNVLVTCSQNNIGSAKTIQKNMGLLENELLYEGEVIKRYWINVDTINNK